MSAIVTITVYDDGDGAKNPAEIIAVVTTPKGTEAMHCQPGQKWKRGGIDQETQEIRHGRLRPRAKGKIEAEREEEAWDALRATRDRLLTACDWRVTSESTERGIDVGAWKAYRQALRDLPNTTDDPATPVWPDPPE